MREEIELSYLKKIFEEIGTIAEKHGYYNTLDFCIKKYNEVEEISKKSCPPWKH